MAVHDVINAYLRFINGLAHEMLILIGYATNDGSDEPGCSLV